MKRFLFTLILISAFVSGVFSQNGVIRELTGEVELKPAGATAFARASAGDAVALNTVVSTGFRSTAIIAVGNSLITVRPLTRLSLGEIQSMGNAENVSLNLDTGRIRVDVAPPAGQMTNFTVRSPNATASVRGTSFEFDTINLKVEEGRVIFSGNNGIPVIITEGGVSFVQANNAAADPAGTIALSLAPPPPIGAPPLEAPEQPPVVDSAGSGSGSLTFNLQWPGGGTAGGATGP